MTHRGPFQPQTFCESVILCFYVSWLRVLYAYQSLITPQSVHKTKCHGWNSRSSFWLFERHGQRLEVLCTWAFPWSTDRRDGRGLLCSCHTKMGRRGSCVCWFHSSCILMLGTWCWTGQEPVTWCSPWFAAEEMGIMMEVCRYYKWGVPQTEAQS